MRAREVSVRNGTPVWATLSIIQLALLVSSCVPDSDASERVVDFETHEGTRLRFDLAPDDRTIVFDLLGQLWTLPAEGGEAVPLTDAVRDAGEDLDPAFSPDGETVVFRSDRPGGGGLFAISLDDRTVRRLNTTGLFPHVAQAWSPNGRELVYADWRGIRVLDIATGQSRAVPVEGLARPVASQPSWSPDGERIVFVNPPMAGLLGQAVPAPGPLWEVSAQGGTARPLGEDDLQARAPVYSPDGETLAFFASDSLGRSQLWVMDRNSRRVQLTSHADVTPLRARWRRDGSKILYHADGRLWTVPAAGGQPAEVPFSVRVRIPRRTLERRRVRFPVAGAERPARGFAALSLSPRGDRVAILALGRLWDLEVGGAAPRSVTPVPATAKDLAWSPRQNEVAWSAGAWGAEDLFVTDMSSGATRRLTALEGDEERPSWSPDGERIAFIHDTGPFWSGGESRVRVVPASASRTESTDATIDVGEGFSTSALVASGDHRIMWNPDSGPELLFGRNENLVLASPGGAPRTRPFPEGRSPTFLSWSGTELTYVEAQRLWRAPFDGESMEIGDAVAMGGDAASYPSVSEDGSVLYVSSDGLRIRRPSGDIERLGWPLTYEPLASASLVIRNVRVVGSGRDPDTGPVDIMIEEGRIRRIAASGSLPTASGVRELDADGRFAIPGLIDMHQHTYQAIPLAEALYNGVTTIRDLGSRGGVAWLAAQRDAIDAGVQPGPRIVLGGAQFQGTGTYTGSGVLRVDDDSARIRAVSIMAAFGAEYVKLRSFGDWAGAAELVRDASDRGWPSSGHVASPLPLIAAGIDGKEHLGRTGSGDRSDGGLPYDDIIQLYRAADLWVVPTLAYRAAILATMDHPERLDRTEVAPFLTPMWLNNDRGVFMERDELVKALEVDRAAVRRMHDAGVAIVAGTDRFSRPSEIHLELRELVAAGLTPLQAIDAATRTAARALGASDEIGTIEEGTWADLVILNSDPTDDVTRVADIWTVIKGGVEVDRVTLIRWVEQSRATDLAYLQGDDEIVGN